MVISKYYKYCVIYYWVIGTIVLYIKQELLEIIELKDQCLNMRGGTPLPYQGESLMMSQG